MVAISQLSARIAAAGDFVELARAICDSHPRCGVTLHGEDGRPTIVVHNMPTWRFAILTADLGAIGAASRIGDDHRYVLPILTPTGLVGAIQLERAYEFPPVLQRDLATMATQVSVRCAQLGIVPLPVGRDALTAHQRDVARLAARGDTNARIAAQLAVSQNTVKMHLKEAFARLRVANRTELANVLAKRAPAVDVPLGVTRLATVTVVRLR